MHADVFVVASIADVDAIVSAAQTQHVDVIVALTEAGVLAAAEASERLNLPGLGLDVAIAATDKAEMRKRWRTAKLPQPDFEIAADIQQAQNKIRQIGIPCVVKPTRAWASKGVGVITEKIDVEAALLEAFAVHDGPVIIEEFVPGRLLTAEGFAFDDSAKVVAVGDVETQQVDQHRVNMSLQYPADFDARTISKASTLIVEAARSLGLRRCPFHCECMVAQNGIYLIEMAARGGGGHIFTVLYEPMTGFSGSVRHVQLLLQKRIDPLPDNLVQGGCYRFLSAPAGILERIEGADEASRMPGVIDLGIAIRPGQSGGAVTHDNARHGHVCTIGSNRTEALERAKAAAARVYFIMRQS